MPLDPSALVKRQLLRSVLDGTFTPGMKLPTIRQLARTLRVSSKTVQQAVHELKKEGVLTAKRGVGMTVQPTAPLASRGKKVALVFPQRANYLDGLPYPGKLIAAMERRLAQDGYAIVRFSLAHQDAMNALEALERLRLCGLICFEVDNDPLLLDLRAMRLPMISIDYNAFRHGISTIQFDNPFAVFLATRHLIEQGHRHICFLRPLARNPVKGNRSLDAVEEERLIGYRIAMQAAGLEPWLVEYVHRGDAGRETLLRLMGRRPAPSAFVGMGDHLALQVAKLLIGLGYRIPEDVSLVGIGHYAAEFLPGMQISSVDFNHGRLGTEAAELFLENLRDLHAPPLRRVLPVELKLRHSAAPPPLAPA